MLRASLLCFLALPGLALAQETFGSIDRRDPALDALIPKDAKIEKLAQGFKWVEGPVWVPNGKFVLFSDIPNNAIHKWEEGKGLTRDFIKPAGYTGKTPRPGTEPTDEPGSNGLILDAKGHLTLCEHGDRRVTRLDKDFKNKKVLVDHFEGKKLNSPNDLVYHSNGDLYFTDPPYGMVKHFEDPARELAFCGVYLLKPNGKLTLLHKDMTRPNGITLSPDEKWLYVANSDPKLAIWKKFAVNGDGTLGEGKVFYDATAMVGKKPGLPDGMKVDVKGNVFATGPGGVFIFTPEGKLLGILDTGVPTANCAFGDDGTTLYIAADKALARIRTTTKGK